MICIAIHICRFIIYGRPLMFHICMSWSFFRFYRRFALPFFNVRNHRRSSNWNPLWIVTWRNITLMPSMTTGSGVRNVWSVIRPTWHCTTTSSATTTRIVRRRNESESLANVSSAPIVQKYSKTLADITAIATRSTSTMFVKSGSSATRATPTFQLIEPSLLTRPRRPVTRKSPLQHFNVNSALKASAGNI